MSRPTREEAKGWAARTAHHIENGSRPTEEELCELRNWLASVARVLPSAAAIQWDRASLSRCSLCGQRDGLHGPDCERNPDRPAD